MGTQASGADSWLLLNNVSLSFQPGNENLMAKASEYPPNQIRITALAPDNIEISVDGELLETERYGRWIWRPKGYAGLYQLQVKYPKHPMQIASVRVLPSKLSFERYQQMLVDICSISADLLFQLHSPATEKSVLSRPGQRSSALREYRLIRSVVRDLSLVMVQIRSSPHRTLSDRDEQKLFYHIPNFSSEVSPLPVGFLQLPENPRYATTTIRQLPEEWIIHDKYLTYDVYENRLLKHFLWRQLLPKLYSIEERAENEIKRRQLARRVKLEQGWADDETQMIESLESVVQDCRGMQNWCSAWGSEAFLRAVQPLALASRPTQVLQKNPYYNRFYRSYLRFQSELKLSLDSESYAASLALRKISELYETWSVFYLTRVILQSLLRAGYQISSSNGFFEIRDDLFHFEIKRDASIGLSKGENNVVIRYEPEYPPATRVRSGLVASSARRLTPDLSVELWSGGQPRRLLVFDAKYRSETEGPSQVVMAEDIEKMGYYLNAIRWKLDDPRQRLRRIVSSAYVLYPGNVFEHNPEEPEIGAIPLLPRAPNAREVLAVVRNLLAHAQF